MNADLARAIEHYDSLRTMLQRVEASEIWYRDANPIGPRLRPGGRILAVDRDRIFVGLVSKAASTHRAIRALVEAGCPEDAQALSRILLENGVIVAWIRLDQDNRLDNYAAAHSLHQQREAVVVAECYGKSNPDLVKATQSMAALSQPLADILGGKHHQWARKYDDARGQYVSLNAFELFEEVFKQPGVGRPMMYDLPYFRGSAYVHSSMASLLSLIDWSGKKFSIVQNDSDTPKAEALGVSNLVMALIMNEFQGYLGWDLFEPELEAWGKRVTAEAGVGPLFA